MNSDNGLETSVSLVKIRTKTLLMPLCLECTASPDSPHHQLFECPNLKSEHRDRLTASVGNLETNFHLPIIFHTDSYNNTSNVTVMENGDIVFTEDGTIAFTCALCEARKALKGLVRDVCKQSQFQDELLSRPR